MCDPLRRSAVIVGFSALFLVATQAFPAESPEPLEARVVFLGCDSTTLNEASLADLNQAFLDGLTDAFGDVIDMRDQSAGFNTVSDVERFVEGSERTVVIVGGAELNKGRLQLHARVADTETGKILRASIKERAWNARQAEQALLELAHEIGFHVTPKARLAIAIDRYTGFMSGSAGKTDSMVVFVDGEFFGEFSGYGPTVVLWIPVGRHIVSIGSVSYQHRQAQGFMITEGTDEYLESLLGTEVDSKPGCISSILIKDKTFSDKLFAQSSCLELPEPHPEVEEWLQYGGVVPEEVHELVSGLPIQKAGKTLKAIIAWTDDPSQLELDAISAFVLLNSGPPVAGVKANSEFLKSLLKKVPAGEDWRNVAAAAAYCLACTGDKEAREAAQKYLTRALEADQTWTEGTMRYYEQLNPSAGERIDKAVKKAS